jgi:hypothetical protein
LAIVELAHHLFELFRPGITRIRQVLPFAAQPVEVQAAGVRDENAFGCPPDRGVGRR